MTDFEIYRIYAKIFIGFFVMVLIVHALIQIKELVGNIKNKEARLEKNSYFRILDKTLSVECIPSMFLFLLSIVCYTFPLWSFCLFFVFLVGVGLSSVGNMGKLGERTFLKVMARIMIGLSTLGMLVAWMAELYEYS